MFIAALFTIAKMWKQRKCQLTDEWASKIRHAHTMEMSRFWKIALLPHSLICSFNGYFFIQFPHCRFYASFKALTIKWQERLAPTSLPPSHSIHDLFVPQIPGRLRIPSLVLSSHFKFPSLVMSTQVTNSMKMPLKFVSTPRLFYGPNCLKNIAFCVFLRHLDVIAQASPCKPVPCPPVPASVSSLYPGHCLRTI